MKLTAAALVVAIVAIALSFAAHGAGEEGLRSAIRATARVSAVLLAVTFMASSLHAIGRAKWTRWLLLHRRNLGLGFAIVQFAHLGVVLALAELHTTSFRATTAMSSVVGGAIGYVWIAAMAVTSFEGPRKRMGPRAWRALHVSGMYLLWGIFVASYGPRARSQPLYAAFLVLMLLALAVRITARRVRRTSDLALR
ncbi:hypothetical protein [Polyangium sorediatum]|uniref:Ferric oxidoreductase domain-containing protein n=1 Tax=Polyangium sorediatum TaxID=889274 RepID=A0ABT6P5J2_9BACT|nr:hypothetical protein [Polyangium sorediatum]MDI1435804.1 hypothetical protein [Polyangium sorediatum]